MTLLTDIRKDREADPEPGAGWKTGPVIWDEYTREISFVLVGRKMVNMALHNRIARVPQLEEIALAAERVMHCATVANQQGLISKGVSVDLAKALAHLRDLLEGETNE